MASKKSSGKTSTGKKTTKKSPQKKKVKVAFEARRSTAGKARSSVIKYKRGEEGTSGTGPRLR
jgi:hypothetical protein